MYVSRATRECSARMQVWQASNLVHSSTPNASPNVICLSGLPPWPNIIILSRFPFKFPGLQSQQILLAPFSLVRCRNRCSCPSLHSRPERQSGPAHGVAREGYSWLHPEYHARNSCTLPSRGRMTSNPASSHGGAVDGIHSYATYPTHQQNSSTSFPVCWLI